LLLNELHAGERFPTQASEEFTRRLLSQGYLGCDVREVDRQTPPPWIDYNHSSLVYQLKPLSEYSVDVGVLIRIPHDVQLVHIIEVRPKNFQHPHGQSLIESCVKLVGPSEQAPPKELHLARWIGVRYFVDYAHSLVVCPIAELLVRDVKCSKGATEILSQWFQSAKVESISKGKDVKSAMQLDEVYSRLAAPEQV